MSHSSGLGLLVENMWPLCLDSSSTLSKPVTYTLSRKQWIIPGLYHSIRIESFLQLYLYVWIGNQGSACIFVSEQ